MRRIYGHRRNPNTAFSPNGSQSKQRPHAPESTALIGARTRKLFSNLLLTHLRKIAPRDLSRIPVALRPHFCQRRPVLILSAHLWGGLSTAGKPTIKHRKT